MCGIAGILGDVSEAKRRVQAMLAEQQHRGPDDSDICCDSEFAMGHNRLAIIDPSPAGKQPMADSAGDYSITFNGEIYNFKNLRRKLQTKGYSFRSDSDTEVLLKSLIEWKDGALDKLNGDFAFAFYDHRRRVLRLARDRMGVKPLYFYKNQSFVVFASELRAILRSGLVSGRINTDVLPEFLNSQSVTPPKTMVDNIQMLSPAHLLKTNGRRLHRDRYWSIWPEQPGHESSRSTDEIQFQLRRLVETAVERQMVSDVPIGAFLSGGIDSSVVVGVMSKLSSTPVKTITLGFEGDEFEDGAYARLVAERFQTNHFEISINDEEALKHVRAALSAQDHPSKDGINTFIVSRAARQEGLKVALSGIGGDELFAGYKYFRHLQILRKFRWLWGKGLSVFRRVLAASFGGTNRRIKLQKLATLFQSDGSLLGLHRRMRQFLFPGQIQQLLTEECTLESIYSGGESLERGFIDRRSVSETSKISVAEMKTYLQNVLLRDTDQMSLAHSLEVRVPLLDHQLVSYVLGLSDEMKQRGRQSKSLLVTTMRDYIPREVIERSNEGFTMPFGRWLRSSLKDLAEEGLSRVAREPAFRSHWVERYWDKFLDCKPSITASRILLLVSLGHWLSQIDELTD